MTKPYVDHVAIRSRNFERDLDFFQQVLGLEITLTAPEGLAHDNSFDPAKRDLGQLTHIGISIDDVEQVLEKVYATEGVVQAEGKPRNWFVLPEGPMIELVES